MSELALREHVAIVQPWVIDALLAGAKTIESRFSRDRRAPFDRIAKGDLVFFRETGGTYAAQAEVRSVRSFGGLTPDKVAQIEGRHRARIGGDDAFWKAARAARFATLVYLHRCQAITSGPELDRRPGDRRAWFVLD